MRDWVLKKDPIFKSFDKDFFYKNIIPDKITYKYDESKYVTKKELEEKIDHLFKEIDKKKRKFTHFIILKNVDFIRKRKCGFLVLKFKDYPFVLKVFMENPKNFVRPYSKGFNHFFLHGLSGGINRHLLGFTRIKNLKDIKKTIAKNPTWSQHISMPRKWFWVPKDCNEIKLIGKNFRGKEVLKTVIPGTYCIIADAIIAENKTLPIKKKNSKKWISLCNFLDLRIDPGIGNLLLEKGTDKIAVIDTEHYPSLTGFKNRKKTSSFLSNDLAIGMRYLKNMFLQSKKDRLGPSSLTLSC